jgi:hypothetical protein
VVAEITAPGLEKPLSATFTRAEADYKQKGYEVKLIVEQKPARGRGAKKQSQGWAIDGNTKRACSIAASTTSPETWCPARSPPCSRRCRRARRTTASASRAGS